MSPFDSSHGLGRHPDAAANHDPRSLDYPAPGGAEVQTVYWRRYGYTLDQGQIGSCTGNAAAQNLNHAPEWTRGSFKNEADAVACYTLATQIDPYDGSYPDEDTGSDGLSAAKATKLLGWTTSYTHAFGIDHLLAALQVGPLMVGTDWYNDMFNPDGKFQVHPTGGVAGGHEYTCDGVNVKHQMLRFLNSWGSGWGNRGHFYMSFTDFDTLLTAGGDATQLVVG